MPRNRGFGGQERPHPFDKVDPWAGQEEEETEKTPQKSDTGGEKEKTE